MTILTTLSSCQRDEEEPTGETEILYTMPEESETHEGTWLQWPHHYQYGKAYRNSLDATWVSMVKELVSSEKVHIIASIMINEGGSVEIDGHGTLMACKSSILNDNRNPGMTQSQAESIFKKYLGVANFIWLDGQAGLEITDQHIDGFARFGHSNTIVTMGKNDLLYYDVQQSDIDKLYAAKNKNGTSYTFLKVPLTQNNVTTTNGTNLGYKGSYVNYYISNNRILVPNYNDPNDTTANAIIQTLYPNRIAIGIDVRNLYENGGMIHCVTQQQPE